MCAFFVMNVVSLFERAMCFVGKDCFDLFKSMQDCMQKYPTLYSKDLGDDDDLAEAMEASEKSKQPPKEETSSTNKS